MKRTRVVVPWTDGLHFRRAASLVRMSRGFRSTIQIRCGGGAADLRSILSIVALCATMGTGIDVTVAGDDEQAAVQAIERHFSSSDDGDLPTGTSCRPE